MSPGGRVIIEISLCCGDGGTIIIHFLICKFSEVNQRPTPKCLTRYLEGLKLVKGLKNVPKCALTCKLVNGWQFFLDVLTNYALRWLLGAVEENKQRNE